MSETLSLFDYKVVENTTTTEIQDAVYSVEEINAHLKQIIEGQLGVVWIRGELSNFKAHSSGHFYFSLKDDKSQIAAVMFRGFNSKLKFKPGDGLEVLVRGRVTVYEPRGNYQIVCDQMEPVGAGALQKAFEELKEKLKLEGLFDPKRKKSIPLYPQHVAIITSPTGAAIRDILNILGRRAKNIEVTIVPTVVQGAEAAPKICEALVLAQKLVGVDVIIIGRGGGSIEDLWAFNDETLARRIAACSIPVISAVGHEIDFTICDFVSDLRAPTPSAAAELVAKSSVELLSVIENKKRILKLSFARQIEKLHKAALHLSNRLIDPKHKLEMLIQRNDELFNKLHTSMDAYQTKLKYKLNLLKEQLGSPAELIQLRQSRLQMFSAEMHNHLRFFLDKRRSQWQQQTLVLDSLSPLKVVDRGYAIVTKNQSLVKNAEQVIKGDHIQIRVSQGQITAKVEKTERSYENGI